MVCSRDPDGPNSCRKFELAAHDEKGFVLKAGKLRAETLGVVVLLDVDDLFGGSNSFNGDIAVAAVMENDEAAMVALEEKFESDIAVGHGNDGVHDIGIAAASQIPELLIDDVHCFAFVEFCGEFFDSIGDEIADAA